jgi:hypothetical protein
MKRLQFSVQVAAPPVVAWETMLGRETYEIWTSAFAEGSTYEGSWGVGDRIRFLAPDGSGVTSVIAESRPHAFVSIKHLGLVEQGVEDTESDAVKAWAPAFENYSFRQLGHATEIVVDIDVTPDSEAYMVEHWPIALDGLKELCASRGRAASGT